MHKYNIVLSGSPTQLKMRNFTRKVAPGNFLAQFADYKELSKNLKAVFIKSALSNFLYKFPHLLMRIATYMHTSLNNVIFHTYPNN